MLRNLLHRMARPWSVWPFDDRTKGARKPGEPLPVREGTFLIRLAVKGDYEQICELYEELDSYHRQARPDLFDRPSAPPRPRSTIFALIGSDATAILVAEDEASHLLLGFCLLMIRDLPASTVCLARRFVELDKLAVRAKARRSGVGRALVQAAFAWAQARGFDCVEVAVHEFNAGAIAFYESMGFETFIRRMMRRG
jgi:ribosomal protein S18 acetylase RimI-like enzyme